MAVTVSAKNYTYIDDCESLGPWDGLVDGLVTDFFKEGSQCIGVELWSSGTNDHTLTGSWDLSGVKHLHLWWMTTVLNELDTDANGGFQIGVSDGVNTGFWLVSGSTTYPGGWYNPVIDLSRDVDSGTKPDMSVLTSIILRWILTDNAKKVESCWIDNLYCADGLIAYGDDGGNSFDLADILSADQDVINGWGIIRKIGGVYYLIGSLDIGDETGTNSCDFKDTGQIVIFEDRKVNDDLYKWKVVGNATGDTGFQLGNRPNGAGVQGLIIKSEAVDSEPLFDFLCSGILVSGFLVYGTTFVNADDISFPESGLSREVLSCNFESSGEVEANSCKVRLCKFIGADGRGIHMLPTHDIEGSDFIACSHGVHISISGEYDFNDLLFLNNLYDIENSVSGVVIVSNINSDAATYENTGGGTTSILTGVTLYIKVLDEDTDPIQNAQVAIYKVSDGTELMNEDTDIDGEAEATFNYVSDTGVYVRVRKSSIGATKYIPFSTTGTIEYPAGLSVTVTLYEDPNA